MKKFVFMLVVLGIIIVAGAAANNASKKPPAKKVSEEGTISKDKTVAPPLTNNSPKNTTSTATKGISTMIPPSAQVLSWEFERETITASVAAKSNNNLLHVALSSGQEGDIPIQYEGGTPADRYAKIISDQTKTGNHLIHFWLKNATIPTGFGGDYAYKGRIQLNLYDISYTSIFTRYRMYLHPDLKFYKTYPNENTWFTISELWFRGTDGNNFRIPLNIVKEAGVNKPLYFFVGGDAGKRNSSGGDGPWKNIWGQANTQFEVPVGEWIDMEIGYKQGNKNFGRFYLAAKRVTDAKMVTVFDITDWTYNPDAKTPTPLTGWNPLKLYTSGKVIKHIRESGGVAQIYWDDFKLFDHWSQ